MARNNAQTSGLEQCITGRHKIKNSKMETTGHRQERANNQQELDSVPKRVEVRED